MITIVHHEPNQYAISNRNPVRVLLNLVWMVQGHRQVDHCANERQDPARDADAEHLHMAGPVLLPGHRSRNLDEYLRLSRHLYQHKGESQVKGDHYDGVKRTSSYIPYRRK